MPVGKYIYVYITTKTVLFSEQAFENAITVVYALGGSTNAVLHLLALAREADVPLVIEDFNRYVFYVSMHGWMSMYELCVYASMGVYVRYVGSHLGM